MSVSPRWRIGVAALVHAGIIALEFIVTGEAVTSRGDK
jgi:hypothetical protein